MSVLTVAVQNGSLDCQVSGSKGATMILLHAGVADSRMWDEPAQRLASQFRVVRFDMRGFGSTRLPNGAFSYADDVQRVIEAGRSKAVWLVGASFGGRVAIDVALSCPELVTGLVLIAPAVSGFQPTGEIVDFGNAEDELLESGQLEAAAELNVRMWVDGPFRTEAQVDGSIRRNVFDMQLAAFEQPEPENADSIQLQPPAIGRLEEIQVPVLIITGALDVPDFVALSEFLEGRIPDVERIVVPDAAHMVSMECPQRVAAWISEFVEAH